MVPVARRVCGPARALALPSACLWAAALYAADAVKQEHAGINVAAETSTAETRTQHPDAQWFPEAGLGFFIHWDIAAVRGINIGWSMIEGLNGRPASITPNDYFAQAEKFNPQSCDPDRWLRAAKDAGFTYAVLTTRHHSGYALWPSAYGNFDTRVAAGGRDFVRDYVEACRRHGLKVGLYYSPPHWNFEREFKNFRYRGEGPPLDADLKPRTTTPSPEELARHQAAYAVMVRGQVEELLSNYGRIDLLWFDGRPPVPNPAGIIPLERIRELQPGIVVNGRLHGRADFLIHERTLRTAKIATEWTEFCNPWSNFWSHVEGAPLRSLGFVIGQYATCRSYHINYLLSVGPTADGDFTPDVYAAMTQLGAWMKQNGAAVRGAQPLPAGETASAPATAAGDVRHLFALPKFKDNGNMSEAQLPPEDETFTLSGVPRPRAVTLLATGAKLEFSHDGDVLQIVLPASLRTPVVDVIKVDLPPR